MSTVYRAVGSSIIEYRNSVEPAFDIVTKTRKDTFFRRFQCKFTRFRRKVGPPLFNTLYRNISVKKSPKPWKSNSDTAKMNQIHRRN